MLQLILWKTQHSQEVEVDIILAARKSIIKFEVNNKILGEKGETRVVR